MSMRPIGRVLNATGAMRWYRDGSSMGFVWRWWHPVSWVVAPLAFVADGLLSGFPEAWKYRHNLGFGISPYFKSHPERFEWIKP